MRVIALRTACSLVFLGAVPAHAAMYRWVDSNGRVQYGDTLPSNYQQSGAAELSKHGQVIKRTASEAERKAAAENATEQARVKRLANEQARLDHALTATYTTEAEIDLARDRALEYHKLAINGAKIRAKVVDANLQGLRQRAAPFSKARRAVPANLQSQIAQSEREALELRRTVAQNEEAMVKVREKYDADKQRFKTLTANTP